MDPERISPDELAYWVAVQERVRETSAINQHWSQHLARKYQLGSQDRIGPDGVIVRLSPGEMNG